MKMLRRRSVGVLAAGLTWLIRAYQLICRPILPPACKFTPSCSDYAIVALRRHGVVRGLALSGWRILRCNPFTAGGYDPVPGARPAECRRHTEDIGAP